MNRKNDINLSEIKKLQNLYNIIPNVFWSALSLVPISIFCYTLLDLKFFYIFLVISLVCIFLPNSFFDKIQVSQTTRIYKKLGVNYVNKLTQNGDIIKKIIQAKYPEFKVVNFRQNSLKGLIGQTYIYEKFHFGLFLFFNMTFFFALICKFYGWAIVILLTNLIYNVYPNLLQQYIRIKLKLYSHTKK